MKQYHAYLLKCPNCGVTAESGRNFLLYDDVPLCDFCFIEVTKRYIKLLEFKVKQNTWKQEDEKNQIWIQDQDDYSSIVEHMKYLSTYAKGLEKENRQLKEKIKKLEKEGGEEK